MRRPPPLVAAALCVAAAVGLLFALGLLIGHRPFAFDHALLLALREPGDRATPLGGPGMLAFMRDVTALGAGTILTLAVIAAAGLLLVRRRPLLAALVAASTLSGGLLVSWAKLQSGRDRPGVVPHLVDVTSLSFPSGHAANSAIVYLTLAALACAAVRERRARQYLIAAALALVALIGVSRVYLGVHWPSDVLAGWAFGALWALGWWWAGIRARETG